MSGDNRAQKRALLEQFLSGEKADWASRKATLPPLPLRYHDLPVVIHAPGPVSRQETASIYPISWFDVRKDSPSRFLIQWFSPAEAGFENPEFWSNDLLPFCDIEEREGMELAVQRDFAGIHRKLGDGTNEVLIIAPPQAGDGFFNAMRWLLPRQLLKKRLALLHSSCTIGRDGKAHVFLGPSGAGKSTVAEIAKASGRTILGDDMNVFGFDQNNKPVIELGLFGQSMTSGARPGHRYPVGGFYFLKQSSLDSKKPVGFTESSRRIIASLSGLFWDQAGPDVIESAFEFALDTARAVPCFELAFNLEGGFWKYVDGETGPVATRTLADIGR